MKCYENIGREKKKKMTFFEDLETCQADETLTGKAWLLWYNFRDLLKKFNEAYGGGCHCFFFVGPTNLLSSLKSNMIYYYDALVTQNKYITYIKKIK